MTASSALLAAESESTGVQFHAPSIWEFYPEAILFADTPFEMNRIMIIRMIMIAVLVLVFWLGTRRMTVVPGRFQGLIEMSLDLVRVNIAEDLLGKKDGRRFLPILTTIFFIVLFLKITGIVFWLVAIRPTISLKSFCGRYASGDTLSVDTVSPSATGAGAGVFPGLYSGSETLSIT